MEKFDNDNFKIDFGNKIAETRKKKIFKKPIFLTFESPEILKVDKRNLQQMQKFGSNIDKRFKIISIIVTLFFLSTYFVLFVLRNKELFETLTMGLYYGILVWFFADFTMLRENKFYLRCLVIAIFCCVYGIVLGNQYENNEGNLLKLSGISSLSFLIVQKPVRLIYLKLFKREPKIDGFGKFADLIYTMMLFLASIVLPMIIMDKIK